jgi:hypothetical protein
MSIRPRGLSEDSFLCTARPGQPTGLQDVEAEASQSGRGHVLATEPQACRLPSQPGHSSQAFDESGISDCFFTPIRQTFLHRTHFIERRGFQLLTEGI